MNEKPKNIMVAGRFILGLGILVALEVIAAFIQHSPMLPFVGGIVMPPLAMLFFPPIISAAYFMFSSKMRWRIDILLLLLSTICIVIFASSRFGNL